MTFNLRSGHAGGQHSTVAFPRLDSTATVSDVTHNPRYSTLSFPGTGRYSITRASALELHELIYGTGTALNPANSDGARAALDKLYEPDAVYSNPLLTASSGNVIKDIHSLMHQFTSVSVPTPFSFLTGLLKGKDSMDWLTIAKVWSEVGEVLESDVYDGHRRVVIEHTVYLLFLPNVFSPDPASGSDAITVHGSASSLSLPDSVNSANFGPIRHPTLGGIARLLTTLARQVSLPVHTRLSFNDSGRITHHQDIWDVKDVLCLVPGVGIAQWIASRMLAHGLASAFDVYAWASSVTGGRPPVKREGDETPRGTSTITQAGSVVTDSPRAGSVYGNVRSTSGAPASSALNALGLQLSERLNHHVRSRAPDTDNDA